MGRRSELLHIVREETVDLVEKDDDDVVMNMTVVSDGGNGTDEALHLLLLDCHFGKWEDARSCLTYMLFIHTTYLYSGF
jgi:hypothetical protein